MKKGYTGLESMINGLIATSVIEIIIASIIIVTQTGSIKLIGVAFGLSIMDNIIFLFTSYWIFKKIFTIERYMNFKKKYNLISIRTVVINLLFFLTVLFFIPIHYILMLSLSIFYFSSMGFFIIKNIKQDVEKQKN